MITLDSTHRRGFFARVGAALAGAVTAPRLLEAAAVAPSDNPDAWLEGLNAPHRCLFDSPQENGGLPMVHILNYLNTYNSAYGVKDSEINTVGTFYGFTTLHALNDAMWAKYRLGEFLSLKDASGAAPTANPWRTEVRVPALGMTVAAASTEALQKRGTVFILCNNALGLFIGEVAKARGVDRAVVDKDFRANVLPGVTIVPAMVVAIEKAQAKGLAYNKQ
jgi:intracellular sulfur oxidation DsrE/DsrF family protein